MAESHSAHISILLDQGKETLKSNDEPLVELLFAEDLMSFVMHQHKLQWLPSTGAHHYRETVSSTFIPEIGRTIILLTNEKDNIIKTHYMHFLASNFYSAEDFKYAARGLAFESFTEGYNALDFLIYCSKITRLAVMYFKDGVTRAPDMAVHVIVETLTKRLKEAFDLLGTWELLYEECSKVLGDCIVGER